MKSGDGTYTMASLFCGLGGMDLGFSWAGFKTIWANDIVPQAVETYERNLGFRPVCEDIERIDLGRIPQPDIVIGGPPCQSFSLVGRRRPDDPRGRLVFRFLDAVRTLEPKAFAMENVPGMAASKIDGVRLPRVLEHSFARLGYEVTLTKLTATDFLVPQRRSRLFVLGCKGWRPQAPDGRMFASECYGVDAGSYDLSAKGAIGDLGPCVGPGERAGYRTDVDPSQFALLMRSGGLKGFAHHECPRMSDTDRALVQHIPPGGNYRDIPDDIATKRVMKFKRSGGRTTTYGRLHPDRPAYTINTYFRRPNVGSHFHYSEPRLITMREAMRFQSLPDHLKVVDAAQDRRNALIGNAVPPLMAHAVAWALRKAILKEYVGEAPIQHRLC